jgi:hypothetical protein
LIAEARTWRDRGKTIELARDLLEAGPFALAVKAGLQVFAHGTRVGKRQEAVLIIEETLLDALAVHGGKR